MKRKDNVALLSARIAGLMAVRNTLTYQIELLQDLHEDLILGTKDG